MERLTEAFSIGQLNTKNQKIRTDLTEVTNKKMQSMKETASNIAASAKSGMDKTKATLEEKAEKMTTRDPIQKDMATQKKEAKINQAELQKREVREHNAAMKESGTGLGYGSATHSTTGHMGHNTGTHQMSALPGHGTGQPTGQVVEGTTVTEPIGKNTGTGRTTAHNTHVGGGGATGYGYGTGGGYSG